MANFFQELRQYLTHAETWNLLVVLIGGAVLCTAVAIEYVWIQEPCNLCLSQRYLLFLGTIFALSGLVVDPRLGIMPVLSILAYLGGAFFAVKQIDLQLNPDKAHDCGASLAYMIESKDWPFKDILRAFMEGSSDCAEASWIPTASLLAFVVLTVMSVLQLFLGPRTKY